MEPKTQVEIQLGHMCNNRCVFCVSGQETALGRARPLPEAPILERLNEAFAKGHRKLTLLGGEPTLQPSFKAVVAHAVALGFEEVVLFTNGVKTARAAFLDEVLALSPRARAASALSLASSGGYFTWRISIQGATCDSHEGTTRKLGSFGRILRTMEALQARGERVTVNMCVVGSNYASVDSFPELIERYNVRQLHLDMVRPMDAGARTEEEFASMMPSYALMVPPLVRLAQGVRPDFDLNIGNFPYCFAPELARYIHHDGEETETIAVDGEQDLSRPWNKYFVKRRDKFKPPGCEGCVFSPRCSGVFQKYAELRGVEEVRAVTPERLREVDPELMLFWAHMTPLAERVSKLELPGLQARAWLHGDRELRVSLQGEAALELALCPPGLGAASTSLFSVQLVAAAGPRQVVLPLLLQLWELIIEGQEVWHPPGADALQGGATKIVLGQLRRLRQAAPFGGLSWRALDIEPDGRRATLSLTAVDGGEAELWVAEQAGRPSGGYRVLGEPTPALRQGLTELLACLRAPRVEAARAG